MGIGFSELVLILLFVLIVFGGKRIPELARALGRASYEFKKAKAAFSEEGRDLMQAAEKIAEKEDRQATAPMKTAKDDDLPADAEASAPGATQSEPSPENPSGETAPR